LLLINFSRNKTVFCESNNSRNRVEKDSQIDVIVAAWEKKLAPDKTERGTARTTYQNAEHRNGSNKKAAHPIAVLQKRKKNSFGFDKIFNYLFFSLRRKGGGLNLDEMK